MKFTAKIHFYCVNDDNTITFFIVDENQQKQFYRASARFKVLGELDDLKRLSDDEKNSSLLELEATFGLAYVRSKGLVLQLIEYK